MGVMGKLARRQAWLNDQEVVISSWMERHGYRMLRLAMGIVFIWFGMLKPFGVSPTAAHVRSVATARHAIGYAAELARSWEALPPGAHGDRGSAEHVTSPRGAARDTRATVRRA